MGDLLEPLLQQGSHEARAFASLLLSDPIPSDGERRRRAAMAAAMLLMHSEGGGWDHLWPLVQKDAAFGCEVIAIVTSNRHEPFAANLTRHLTEDQTGDLYLWLLDQYPPSEDPQPEGAHFVEARESVAHFRDAVLRQLQFRQTPAACRTMGRLAITRPDLTWLRWAAVETRANMLRGTWIPPMPVDLLRLTRDRDLRLVESGEQLLEVVIGSLRRLEQELQGDNPGAPDLWNKVSNGSFRPKDENELSDYVVRHLKRDIQNRGIVANREVEIRRGAGDAKGERTDIRIDAITKGSRPEEFGRITVTVETKGCWNKQLLTGIEHQLRDRYLADNTCQHGLYLVGWFDCPQWDADDYRRNQTPKMALDEARQQFDDEATRLSKSPLVIRSLVLNAALR
jgi:hypothetical protein